jgi:hypothetical protein
LWDKDNIFLKSKSFMIEDKGNLAENY